MASTESKNINIYLPFIDGYKGIAILGVFFYHYLPNTINGGFLGVPLFFLLSGYLLAVSAKKRPIETSEQLIDYYYKKIRRIYPTLCVFIGLTLLVLFFWHNKLLQNRLSEVFSIFLAYNNFWQISQNASYFERIANSSPFTHLWYLAIQLQYFLVWPLICFTLNFGKKIVPKIDYLLLILAFLSMLSMTIKYDPTIDVSYIYYHTLTRISALLIGSWIGWQSPKYWRKWTSKLQSKYRSYLFYGLLVVNLFANILVKGQAPSTYLFVISAVTIIQSVLLIISSTYPKLGRWLLSSPILVWLGKRSLEIYFWHYTVFYFYNIAKIHYEFWHTIVLFALICALTIATYELFNNNLKGQSWNNIKHASYFLSLAGLVLLFFTSVTNSLQTESSVVEITSVNPTETSSDSINELDRTEMTTELIPSGRNQWLVNQPITFIGDSVMLGAAKALQSRFPNAHINASESRQEYDVIPLIEDLKQQGLLSDIVVVGLGTNGYFQKISGQQLIDAIGPNRTIFWINVFGEFLQWEIATNDIIYELVAENSNLYLIDWEGQVKNNLEWLTKDGIHPETTGIDAYVDIIHDALEANLL